MTRETLDFLLALAIHEARALRAAMNLAPGHADVAALLVDIAKHRATANRDARPHHGRDCALRARASLEIVPRGTFFVQCATHGGAVD